MHTYSMHRPATAGYAGAEGHSQRGTGVTVLPRLRSAAAACPSRETRTNVRSVSSTMAGCE